MSTNQSIYILLAVFSFIVIVLRAIYHPLVHDEIATFYYYVQPFSFNPLNGAHPDANNHIVNSFLSGLIYKYFGYSVIKLRLLNILAAIPFFIYVYKIGTFLLQKQLKWIFYLSLLFSLYFIQFFAFSRGYGISMTFLIGCFYYLIQFTKKFKSVFIVGFTFCFVLALFSNLSLLPLLLVLCLLVVILFVKDYKANTKQLLVLLINAVVVIYALYKAVLVALKLREDGSLYYGELDGYWLVTIKSELNLFFGSDNLVYQIVLAICLIVFFFFLMKELRKRGLKKLVDKQFIFSTILISIVLATILMAVLIKVNYPSDRVGMYLLPLLTLSICFLLDNNLKWQIALPLLLLPLHFILSFNLVSSSIWDQRGNIDDSFFEEIDRSKSGTEYSAHIGGDYLRQYIFKERLYRNRSKANGIQCWPATMLDSNGFMISGEHPGKYYDFLVANSFEIKEIKPLFDSIACSKGSNLALFKRKFSAKKELLLTENTSDSNFDFGEYYNLLKTNIKPLTHPTVMLGFKLNLEAKENPFKGRVVAQISNARTKEVLDYQYIQLNWINDELNLNDTIKQTLFISNLPTTDSLEVLTYVWNQDQKGLKVENSVVEIFEVFD